MPKFVIVPHSEALAKSSNGKRAQIVREYAGYLEALTPGQAGRLIPLIGETPMAIRRRLNAAAQAAGTELVVRRVRDEVIFWVKGSEGKRRGRRRKTDALGHA